jgi:hypothetical protein
MTVLNESQLAQSTMTAEFGLVDFVRFVVVFCARAVCGVEPYPTSAGDFPGKGSALTRRSTRVLRGAFDEISRVDGGAFLLEDFAPQQTSKLCEVGG